MSFDISIGAGQKPFQDLKDMVVIIAEVIFGSATGTVFQLEFGMLLNQGAEIREEEESKVLQDVFFIK